MSLAKPYLILGLATLVIALLISLARLPEIKTEPEIKSDADIRCTSETEISIWKHKHFILAVVAQAAYCAAQTGIFSFFINYVTEADAAISPLQASRYLAFGGMALFMIGRLTGSFVMARFEAGKLLTAYSVICTLCMLVVMLRLGNVSLYALYAAFFFMSIMFPTIFALGIAGMGGHTKRASSFIIMGVGGGAVSPILMGYLGEQNMATGFIVPLLCFLFIAFFGAKGCRM
jgi:FHS family L-fucose permease-like MFS transporter